MTFNLITHYRENDSHLWPHLTSEQLRNIMLETAPTGGLRSRVSQWIDSDDDTYSDTDFAGRTFTIVRN